MNIRVDLVGLLGLGAVSPVGNWHGSSDKSWKLCLQWGAKVNSHCRPQSQAS